jgi:hypothetical protein
MKRIEINELPQLSPNQLLKIHLSSKRTIVGFPSTLKSSNNGSHVYYRDLLFF